MNINQDLPEIGETQLYSDLVDTGSLEEPLPQEPPEGKEPVPQEPEGTLDGGAPNNAVAIDGNPNTQVAHEIGTADGGAPNNAVAIDGTPNTQVAHGREVPTGEARTTDAEQRIYLGHFDVHHFLRHKPDWPVQHLIARTDPDTDNLTRAELTTTRPTFPTFSRGTYTLPPAGEIPTGFQGPYHFDPMRSAITALFLRLYQRHTPKPEAWHSKFYSPVEYHVPVISTPKVNLCLNP